MALPDSLIRAITRSPGDVAKEQFKKLYLRLFPYIVDDFYYKGDIDVAFTALQAELEQLRLLLRTHVHTVAAVGAGATTPTTVPVLDVTPGIQPEGVLGDALVVPAGAPQPTGAGISMQDTKADPDPIAIPPINPLDPSV